MSVNCPVCRHKSKLFFSKGQYYIYRCLHCGLGFIKPMPSFEEVKKVYCSYFHSHSEFGYQVYSALEQGLKKQYCFILSQIKKFFPKKKFKHVLDIGCAYGYFLDVVAQRWHIESLTGVDISKEVGKTVKEKGYGFISGPIEKVPLPTKYDFIFLGDSFEHFYHPEKVVERLSQVLLNKGVIVITTINFNSFIARFFKEKWRLMTPPEHLFFWTPKAIKILFARYGFKVRCQKYWLFYSKSYVYQRFQDQFGFKPYFLKLSPFDLVPIYSFDTFLAIAWRDE